jgi:hypothetical protein
MKIFLILSCNLSNIQLIKYAFAHLVLLNCKFRHTKMLFSDHQNSVKSSPKSRKWHFRDSKFKNFLGPLALAFSSPIKKSFLQHCNPNPSPNPILLTDSTRQRGSSARHVPIVLGNFWATFCVWSNFFRLEQTSSNFFSFEQLFTTLLVAKNGMTPSFSLFGALQLNGGYSKNLTMSLVNPLRPSNYFFTCLTPDDFTRQQETLQLNGLNRHAY